MPLKEPIQMLCLCWVCLCAQMVSLSREAAEDLCHLVAGSLIFPWPLQDIKTIIPALELEEHSPQGQKAGGLLKVQHVLGFVNLRFLIYASFQKNYTFSSPSILCSLFLILLFSSIFVGPWGQKERLNTYSAMWIACLLLVIES